MPSHLAKTATNGTSKQLLPGFMITKGKLFGQSDQVVLQCTHKIYNQFNILTDINVHTSTLRHQCM